MNFSAYAFLMVPSPGARLAHVLLLALGFLANSISAQAEACATDEQAPVMHRTCTAVATSVHAEAREGVADFPKAISDLPTPLSVRPSPISDLPSPNNILHVAPRHPEENEVASMPTALRSASDVIPFPASAGFIGLMWAGAVRGDGTGYNSTGPDSCLVSASSCEK